MTKQAKGFAVIERDLMLVENYLAGETDDPPECELLDLDLRRTPLDEVRRALTQLRRGIYGICVDCRGPVAIERLRVRPLTHLCKGCMHADEVNERARSARIR